jgi:membrane dipeptidase
VIDLHVDLPYRVGYKGKTFARGSGEFVANELVRSGLRGVVLPLFVPKDAAPSGRTLAQLEASYARVFGAIVATPPYALPGCSVGQAGSQVRAVETWLSFEGAEPVGEDEQSLRRWAARGVRLFGLVHSEHNDLATSSGQAPGLQGVSGLSQRGEQFVRSVYGIGGLIDISHASDQAAADVLGVAAELGVPVVATHSNARALASHPRNLTDAQIRAIAASGGVIGVNFHQRFLAPATGRATLRDVVEMVRYLAEVGGDGVVAIGSDFEGGIRAVPELSSARRYQALARALRQAGFSAPRVEAFLAGNARRVLCK